MRRHRLPPAIGINSRVIGVYISLDDLVNSDWITLIPATDLITGVGPGVRSHVVISHVAMNATVAVQVGVVHIVVDDCAVDINIGVSVVNVGVVNLDVWTRAADPASLPATLPAMVVNAMATPVKVIVQPRPARKLSPRRSNVSVGGNWRRVRRESASTSNRGCCLLRPKHGSK